MVMMTWIAANWVVVLAMAYAALNVANAMLPECEAKNIVHRLLDALSLLTAKGDPNSLKMAGRSSKCGH